MTTIGGTVAAAISIAHPLIRPLSGGRFGSSGSTLAAAGGAIDVAGAVLTSGKFIARVSRSVATLV